jgi:hypothetical protein
MPRRASTPATRNSAKKKEIQRIRRTYKKNTSKRTKLIPAEVPHVEFQIVVLKLANYSRTQIARIVGISRDQVAEMLEQPSVIEKLVDLRQKIPAAALELLQDFQIEAVVVLADVMRASPDDSLRIKAAESILDRGGVVKISKQERLNVNEDKTTITDDGIVDKLREASPEVQEKAAQLIEQLEEILTTASESVNGDREAQDD